MKMKERLRRKEGSKKGRKFAEIQEKLEDLEDEEVRGGKLHLLDSSALYFTDTTKQKISNIHGGKAITRKLKNTTTLANNPLKKSALISREIKFRIERDARKFKAQNKGKFEQSGDSRENQKKIKLLAAQAEFKVAQSGYDIWAPQPKPLLELNPYLSHLAKVSIRKPVTITNDHNTVPAVLVMHPGGSYKPTPSDHHSIIEIAAQVEYDKVRAKEEYQKQLEYPKELDSLPQETPGDESSASDDEVDPLPIIEKKELKFKIKTRAEKNRAKGHKELQQREKMVRDDKKLNKQINNISQIKSDIGLMGKKQGLELVKREELKARRNGGPIRATRYDFKATDIEVKLSDEMNYSLRSLVPEGDLVKDRFRSLQARGIVETRVEVKKKRKFKERLVDSHDYKRFS